VGELTAQNTDGYALVGDPSCGDQMKLWITVKSGRIADIAFRSFGCPGAIATSSMLTVLAKGKPIADAKRITDDDVVDALGGPANWEIGDDVIIPPPGSCGTAKERMDQAGEDYECLDWFLCLKKCPHAE
jgi:NifU-like protein involved in Fe-S cluster formation